MKPAYNEVVRRIFFYGTQAVQSVLSGRPGDDAPYYTHTQLWTPSAARCNMLGVVRRTVNAGLALSSLTLMT